MHVFDPLDQTLPEVTEVRELSCRLAVSLLSRPGQGMGGVMPLPLPGQEMDMLGEMLRVW